MGFGTASFSRKETRCDDQPDPSERGGPIAVFNLYSRIVDSPPSPAQFGRYTTLRYKLNEIDSYFIGDVFRVSGLKDLLEEMGALRSQITTTPNDYLKKCFALRWAEYLQLIQQYDREVPLKWATDHGSLVLQHLIEVQDASQEALSLWVEVASEAEATAEDRRINT